MNRSALIVVCISFVLTYLNMDQVQAATCVVYVRVINWIKINLRFLD
jgi:hypothetical protein